MANEKISELTELTAGNSAASDVLPIVDVDDTSVSITGQTKKITVSSLFNLPVDTNVVFEGSTANAYETTLTVTDPTADRTVTLPNATDTLVGLATTDTLTNKTLTSPAINTAVVSGGTVDNVVIGGTTAAAGTFTQVDIESQGDLRLQDSSGGEYVALQAPATATSYTLTMPTGVGSSGQVLETSDGSGTLAWVTRDVGDITGVTAGTNISITDPTGPVPTINVDNPVVANLTGDASGSSGSCTGNSATATLASTVTVTDSTANTEFPVVLHDESNALLDDTAAFTYNPSSSTVTATTFVGALTGNASGTAATVTGAAQTAITSVGTLTGLTTADLTVTGTSTTIGTVTSGIWGTGSVIAGTTMTLGSDDTGDVYYRASGGVLTRLGNSGGGDDDKVLTLASGLPTWAAAAGGGAAIDTAVTGATEGSVLFAGADAGDGGVLAQDNDKLFFDATNYRLGVGAGTSPLSAVDATTTGTGSTEYGVRGRALGGATSNYGGYFEASGATNNVALATLGDENQFMNGSGTIKIYFDTALGRIGIGQATAASYSLEVTGTAYARDIAASANGVWGVVGTSATNHTTLIGLRGEVHDDVDVTTVGTGYAVYGYCEGNPVVQMGGYFATAGTQATSTNAYGVYGEVTQGPTDDAYGGYFTASDASSGGTTNAYGVKGLATGNATNNYGGYFKASNGTNDYGLIVASGDVGIGTELPDQLLDVRGNV